MLLISLFLLLLLLHEKTAEIHYDVQKNAATTPLQLPLIPHINNVQ